MFFFLIFQTRGRMNRQIKKDSMTRSSFCFLHCNYKELFFTALTLVVSKELLDTISNPGVFFSNKIILIYRNKNIYRDLAFSNSDLSVICKVLSKLYK